MRGESWCAATMACASDDLPVPQRPHIMTATGRGSLVVRWRSGVRASSVALVEGIVGILRVFVF